MIYLILCSIFSSTPMKTCAVSRSRRELDFWPSFCFQYLISSLMLVMPAIKYNLKVIIYSMN